MSRTRPLPGSGWAVEVAPDRLSGFLDRFAARHGGVTSTVVHPRRVVVRASDGATATMPVPFGPLDAPAGEHSGLAVAGLLAHLHRPRRIGLVLVRLGGHSVGVAEDGVVFASSTGQRPVHGRSAAGGWSQKRFARRRAGQAREALRSAADTVARLLVPIAGELDAVMLGGDRAALRELAADRRIAGLLARAEPRVLDLPGPRRAALDDAARRVRWVEVEIRDPS